MRQYAIKYRNKYLTKGLNKEGNPELVLTKDINEAFLWSLDEPLDISIARDLIKYGSIYTNGNCGALVRIKLTEDII